MNASADDDAIVEAFDRVCTQLGGFAERLNTEWIDGYLTALVAGPRTVMPSEWLPAVTGDAFERAFADPDDVARAMEALLGRWNQIAADLNPEALDADPDALRLRPVLLQYEDEAPVDEGGEAERWTGMEWAGGFMQAAADHADDWSAPAQVGAEAAQQFEQCLDAIKALTLDDEGLARFVREAHGGKARARAELIHDACYAAQDLRLFWLDNAPRPSPLRVAPKPGRNDPCPCGSGLKFKKCCAAKQP